MNEVVGDGIKCACLDWLKELSQLPELRVSRWLCMLNDADAIEFYILLMHLVWLMVQYVMLKLYRVLIK